MTTRKQDPFELKVEDMSRGFSVFPLPATTELTFRRESLTPPQVVQRLRAIVEVIQAVRETEAAHQAAVKACTKAMPKDHAFYEEAVAVVKSHFGSDAKVMASFGLRMQRHHREPVPEVVIIEREPVIEINEVVEAPARRPSRHRSGRGSRR